MLFLIDIGNTNTVFAVCRDNEILESWRMHTDTGRTGDEYASFLHELLTLRDIKFSEIHDILVSSVVPEANFSIRSFCQKYLKKQAVFVSSEDIPIAVDLDRPEEMGADRLVNAVAVKSCYELPAVVIDFGTATTFDVIVNQNGTHIGGVIAPGINLAVSALHSASSKLPRVSIKKPEKVIGKNTEQAIQSGIFYGYVSLIEGLINRIKQELGAEPYVIATGGLAELFAENMDIIQSTDQDLTIKGLMEIYRSIKT